MLYILLSILAGISIVLGRVINSNLASRVGIFQGTFFNYVVGLLFSAIFLTFSNEAFDISRTTLYSIPFWAYLGGLSGVLVIMLSNYTAPRMSAFYLTLLVFIGQLFAGIVIDYFTLNKLSIGKVIGGLLVLMGLTYNLIIDKKQEGVKDI